MLPNLESDDITGRFVSLAVAAPVNPEMVTMEPSAKSKLEAKVNVNKLKDRAKGVLCPMSLTLNTGTTTSSAFSPPVTPYKSFPGCVMALDTIVPDPDASMFTVGAVCPEAGLVTSKLKLYVVPAATS